MWRIREKVDINGGQLSCSWNDFEVCRSDISHQNGWPHRSNVSQCRGPGNRKPGSDLPPRHFHLLHLVHSWGFAFMTPATSSFKPTLSHCLWLISQQGIPFEWSPLYVNRYRLFLEEERTTSECAIFIRRFALSLSWVYIQFGICIHFISHMYECFDLFLK